eukprot:365159-Chlamydomonas_euryale.AAC.27
MSAAMLCAGARRGIPVALPSQRRCSSRVSAAAPCLCASQCVAHPMHMPAPPTRLGAPTPATIP